MNTQIHDTNNGPKMTQEEAFSLLSKVNADKIFADNQQKYDAIKLETMSNDRAIREPLPSITEFAFSDQPLVIKNSKGKEITTIRPMVSYDVNLFKKINSPFYRVIMGEVDEKQFFTDEEESYYLIYQFTTPVKEVEKTFRKSKEEIRDIVLDAVAFKYNPSDASLLVEGIMKHIFNVNMARVEFKVDEEQEETKQANSSDILLPSENPEAFNKDNVKKK